MSRRRKDRWGRELPPTTQFDLATDPNPFLTLSPRRRTGTTPPPPISPLGSPPEETPHRRSPTAQERMWSPQKYPDVPIFNLREVMSPPDVVLSPFYGHSTPKPTRPNVQPPGGWTPESEARERNWYRRKKAFEELPKDFREVYSPIKTRRDADSFFDESLEPLWTPKRGMFSPSPPRQRPSPKYDRVETPPRSPAVQLMRDEMKKDEEKRKYVIWFVRNAEQAALRDVVIKGIHITLKERFPEINYQKMNVHQTIGLLSEYLKAITDRLLTQNLELPPLATNNPALSIVEQKKISIRRIIREYQKQYEKVQFKLVCVKDKIRWMDNPQTRDLHNWHCKHLKEELEELNVETRMERIVALRGVCFDWCPYRKDRNYCNMLNKPMEEEVDGIMRKMVELDSECMEAIADMTQFVHSLTPNFLKNLAAMIRAMYPGSRYQQIPPEAYKEAAKDVGKHLRRILREKRQQWVEINREVNSLYPLIKDKTGELEETRNGLEELKRENLKSIVEYKKNTTHYQSMGWMITEARKMLEYNEQQYASTYQALNRAKKKTVELEAELGMSPTGPPELSSGKEPPRTPSPIITHPKSPNSVASPPGEAFGSPVHASSPTSPSRSETEDSLDRELPPSEMLNISDLSGRGSSGASERTLQASGGSPDVMEFSPFQDGGSPGGKASSTKKTFSIPSPGKREPLQIDIEIIPQDIRRSPSGQRVVCDVAVQMQEAALRPPRRIEKRYKVVRGSPPISQTVGRRVDRRHGMFTPRSAIRRGYVGVRRPLFAGDFESPESPFGTGRRTHPELRDLPEHEPSPRPPRLDTTMEWENPELNTAFRK